MRSRTFDDLRSYGAADLAGTHRSTASTQPAIDAGLRAQLLQQLDSDGYVVVERVLSERHVAALRRDLVPRFRHGRGRNSFEGLATQRLYGVLEATTSCDPLLDHPLVLGLLDGLLDRNYLLSQLQAINIRPGESAQILHHDDGFYRWPRPRPALGAATIWSIDEFTTENGATVVIPGSHRWGDRMPTADEAAGARPVVMPAGSLLLFLGTLWHGGGANRATTSRLAITAQYCAPWCRQQENFSLSVSRARARSASEDLKRLLGYSIHPPFMGFVNGMHPKRLLIDGAPGGES